MAVELSNPIYMSGFVSEKDTKLASVKLRAVPGIVLTVQKCCKERLLLVDNQLTDDSVSIIEGVVFEGIPFPWRFSSLLVFLAATGGNATH